MTVARADIFRYSLPLAPPLPLRNRTLTERRGYLIRLISRSGLIGWGEAAPLPGFSTESPEEVVAELRDLRRLLPGRELPPQPTTLTGQFHQWPSSRWWTNSVHCGLEMAALNLVAAERETPLARLLTDRPLETIHLNGLIIEAEGVTEATRALRRAGYRAVKLKLGRESLDRDIARARNVFHELGSNTTLRLDANQSWSFDDALRFADGVADCQIEYIEEPLVDTERLEELAAQTGLALALDESMSHLAPNGLEDKSFVRAIVLKPTVLGGFDRTAAFARKAREFDMKVVISSAFESSIGIAALAQLAAAYDTFNTPAGLDTLKRLESDLLLDPIDCAHGRMRIGQLARVASTVDESALEEIGDA